MSQCSARRRHGAGSARRTLWARAGIRQIGEATREKQPFAFIQSGITPEPRQAELIAEAQDWAGGHYTSNFRDAGELRTKVVQALNRWQLENAAGRVNSDEMRERALVGLPEERRGSSSYRPSIAVSVVGHPRQSIIRPSELEDPALHRQIKQQALFGDPNIFNDGEANEIVLEGHALALKQGARSLTINEDGSVRLVLPLPPVEGMLSPIIEEDVTDTPHGRASVRLPPPRRGNFRIRKSPS
jgi:hypothetical protein